MYRGGVELVWLVMRVFVDEREHVDLQRIWR